MPPKPVTLNQNALKITGFALLGVGVVIVIVVALAATSSSWLPKHTPKPPSSEPSHVAPSAKNDTNDVKLAEVTISPGGSQLPKDAMQDVEKIRAGLDKQGLAKLRAAAAAVQDNKSTADFPVDAVFTWCDGNNPEFWAAKSRAYEKANPGRKYTPNARDPLKHPEGKDELYYSLRTATKFLPWLRRVWIVSARGQKPSWFQADGSAEASRAWPGGHTVLINGIPVTMVHHDVMFDKSCFSEPATFNSNTIEAQVPHIKNLAEHFIMFNDDFFVGKPGMTKQTFFTKTGVPVVDLPDVQRSVWAMTSSWGHHLRTMYKTCAALDVAAMNGGLKTGVPNHIAAPVRKSVLKGVVKALRSRVCSLKPFRGYEDFPVWYVALNAAPHVPLPPKTTWSYYGNGPAFVTAAGNKSVPHLFCINENFTKEAREELAKLLA